MPDIKSLMNDEIRRLAKKEMKQVVEPMREQLAAMRKSLVEQAARIHALEKGLNARPAATAVAVTEDDEIISRPQPAGYSSRITPNKIRRIRKKLGLSQPQFAKLLGVTFFSISHWEIGKTTPRAKSIRGIYELLSMGKRDVYKRLDAMPMD